MKKKLLSVLTLGIFAITSMFGDNAYGIPANIQDGNILHCFNWPIKTVTANLKAIAEAGYGSVQLSPLQRADVQSNWHWYDLYCPADISLKESAAMGTKADLKELCAEAEKYGIKVIVDVVANHVNWTNGFYDTWWDQNGRTRNGRQQPAIGSNYNDRTNITQNRMGDYYDVNSESQEVIDRTVAYIKELASLGVKGIRWDAAKHIALPSESQGGQFWATVTSCVPGMYHYGEILDEPANGQPALIKEYAKYMSVTDNRYSNQAARNNGGIPSSANGNWVSSQGLPASKVVYWGESHDTYSNDEWSQNVDQSVIDRAYASVACRNGSTALYLARPSVKGFGNITINKGTDAYKNHSVAQVNIFRNIMGDRPDYFSNSGNAVSITRQNGGAVIVAKSSGNVSVANGGGYCPEGTYKDRVSGNQFTVTKTTITGNVGPTGIVVLYPEELGEYTPIPDNGNNDNGNSSEAFDVYFDNSSSNWTTPYIHYWGASESKYPGEPMSLYEGNVWSYTVPAGTTGLLFNAGDGDPTKTSDFVAAQNHIYTTAGDQGLYSGAGNNGNGGNNGIPAIVPEGRIAVFVTASKAPYIWAWTDSENLCNNEWPGDIMDKTCKGSNGALYYYWVAPEGISQVNCILSFNGDSDKTSDIKGITANTYLVYTATPGETPALQSVPSTITIATSEYNEGNNNNDNVDSYIYILGNLEGDKGWNETPGTGVAMAGKNKVYTAKNVTFVLPSAEQSVCYFNLTDFVGTSWDELNEKANRYGAATEGEKVTLGKPISITPYLNNIDAMGCLSWTIEPGTYDITADLNSMQLTVNTVSVETPDEDNKEDNKDDQGDKEDQNQEENKPGNDNTGDNTDNGNNNDPNTGNNGGNSSEPGNNGGNAGEPGNNGGNTGEPGNNGGNSSDSGNNGSDSGNTGNNNGNSGENGNNSGNSGDTGNTGGNTDDNGNAGEIESPEEEDNGNNNGDIIEDTGIDGISADPTEPEFYNLQGVKVQNPAPGFYIKVTGNKREKIVIR